ncbi:hypothetical protein [Flavobacterium sp. WV_118_3]|uniref:hypothetical protein n=1 Tax=Flavobacterium sp. WV_118_3 TaxID=3151764 RepID=UPI00321A7EF3
MMQKIVFFLILITGLQPYAQTKDIRPVLLSSVPTESVVFIGNDPFGNTYTIKDNEFRKTNRNQQFQYRNLSFGTIKQVDLQNPLQLVLYYKTFNAAVLLDNQLNEIQKINFSETNPELFPQAVSLASQNRLWLFDLNSQKLGLYDIFKNTFTAISTPIKDAIQQYQSDYNYFYWVDVRNNCYAATIFGKISFLGSVPAFDQLQFISPKQILFQKDNRLFLYDLENAATINIVVPEKSLESFYYKEQILATFTNNEIRNYKITLP